MTMHEFRTALERELLASYPTIPLVILRDGLLHEDGLRYWHQTRRPITSILRETMGRPVVERAA